jgi:hypothetical protein
MNLNRSASLHDFLYGPATGLHSLCMFKRRPPKLFASKNFITGFRLSYHVMRIFKVTPEFINEARNEGLTNLSIEDLVKMRVFKIDGAFIRQAKADGVPLDVEKLVQKRIGVWDAK